LRRARDHGCGWARPAERTPGRSVGVERRIPGRRSLEGARPADQAIARRAESVPRSSRSSDSGPPVRTASSSRSTLKSRTIFFFSTGTRRGAGPRSVESRQAGEDAVIRSVSISASFEGGSFSGLYGLSSGSPSYTISRPGCAGQAGCLHPRGAARFRPLAARQSAGERSEARARRGRSGRSRYRTQEMDPMGALRHGPGFIPR